VATVLADAATAGAFGVYSPLVGAILSVAINAVRKARE
jgi:hypothetical protein